MNYLHRYCFECYEPSGLHDEDCSLDFTKVRRMKFSTIPPATTRDIAPRSAACTDEMHDTQENEAAP